MKPFIAVYVVVLTCGLTHSYPGYGTNNKRYNNNNNRGANVVEPMMPVFTQPLQQQQYYDKSINSNYGMQSQPQYLSLPYPQPRVADDYNYNSRNPNYYNLYPRQDYQTPLYGIPTYRGDYQPKPYYFAQPSYSSSDDHVETTNPLDYLHEEILQENERERTLNNAAFMQNLALYNKQVDSLHGRQQQIQQFQDLYNLKSTYDPDDYDMEQQPTDWYDQTSIVMDPSAYESFSNSDFEIMQQQQQQQQQQAPSSQQQYQQYQSRPSDYDDEMVKELQDLTKQHRKSGKDQVVYNSWDWPQDMPNKEETDDEMDPQEYEDDDTWINWGGQKRNVQPKKDYGVVTKTQTQQASTTKKVPESYKTKSKPSASTEKPLLTTENSKLLAKLHRGQKEVVLPRPAAPVRKPCTEPIMKMMNANKNFEVKASKSEQTPPIYKTIKQIIDMEQNLEHVSPLIFLIIVYLKIASKNASNYHYGPP